MADPATMAGISMAGAAGGGILGAVGNLMKGNSDAKMYEYQAGVARMNENIAKQNADYTRSVGEVQAQEEGMKTAQVIGDTKAKQAGSGVDIASGSSKAVTDTQQEVGKYDESLIRSNAAKKAYGYEVEAASDEAQARLGEFAAKNSRDAGMLGAFTSLLSGASSVAGKWMQYGSTFPGASPRGYSGVGLPPSGTGGLY